MSKSTSDNFSTSSNEVDAHFANASKRLRANLIFLLVFLASVESTKSRPYAGIFSRGGKIIYNRGGKASEGAKRPSGVGGGGVSPLPHEGAFAYLRLKLNDLVDTLGGIFWKIFNKKSKKKIHIHGKCVFLTLG